MNRPHVESFMGRAWSTPRAAFVPQRAAHFGSEGVARTDRGVSSDGWDFPHGAQGWYPFVPGYEALAGVGPSSPPTVFP